MTTLISPLPTPPTRQDSANFNDRADAFLGALPLFQQQASTLALEVNDSATAVEIARQAVVSVANVTKWVSGTTYTLGTAVWSPINGVAYRKITSSVGGTTDPSNDNINYKSITDAVGVIYAPAGTGAVTTTVQAKLREFVSRADYSSDANYNTARTALTGRVDHRVRVEGGSSDRLESEKLSDAISVFDFMTAAQIADVKANTAASNLAAAVDVTTAIQSAINYAATRSSVGGVIYLPPGSYKVSSTIYTYGSGGIGQVGIVGAGIFSTRFFPSGDFTVINLVTSYEESGGFSIEFPALAAASIASTRVGVELASGNWQFSYATLKNVEVRYAYRGFIIRDWTGYSYGTAYLCTLQQCTALRCADWGFHLNSKAGSTTLRLIQCYSRGDTVAGGGFQYGKGIYVNNFNDIYTEQVAVDQCQDNWIEYVNYNIAVMNGTALEGNKLSSTTIRGVVFNGGQTIVNGFKDIAGVFSTGGSATVIGCGPDCTLTLAGYNEQFSSVGGTTTKYRVAFNAATNDVTILDRTVLPTHVLDNGWYHSVVYQGVRLSRLGIAPSYGTWLRGDYVKNGTPAVGQPKGWYCTAAGSPGTWTSEGNL